MYVWNTFRGHIKLQKHFRWTVWRSNIDIMIHADETNYFNEYFAVWTLPYFQHIPGKSFWLKFLMYVWNTFRGHIKLQKTSDGQYGGQTLILWYMLMRPKQTSDERMKPNWTADEVMRSNWTADEVMRPNRTPDEVMRPNRTPDEVMRPNRTSDKGIRPKQTSDERMKPNQTTDEGMRPNRTPDEGMRSNRTPDKRMRPNRTPDDIFDAIRSIKGKVIDISSPNFVYWYMVAYKLDWYWFSAISEKQDGCHSQFSPNIVQIITAMPFKLLSPNWTCR